MQITNFIWTKLNLLIKLMMHNLSTAKDFCERSRNRGGVEAYEVYLYIKLVRFFLQGPTFLYLGEVEFEKSTITL